MDSKFILLQDHRDILVRLGFPESNLTIMDHEYVFHFYHSMTLLPPFIVPCSLSFWDHDEVLFDLHLSFSVR